MMTEGWPEGEPQWGQRSINARRIIRHASRELTFDIAGTYVVNAGRSSTWSRSQRTCMLRRWA